MLVLLLGTGLYLTLGPRAMPVRRLGYGFRQLLRGRNHVAENADEVTRFHSFLTLFRRHSNPGASAAWSPRPPSAEPAPCSGYRRRRLHGHGGHRRLCTGAAVWAAIRFGIARGTFSAEAGLGLVHQATAAMPGTFLDTCTMTALVISVSGLWQTAESGAGLTSLAFGDGITGGSSIVTLDLAVFAFTAIVARSYYGERCAEYLFGVKVIMPYRYLWVILPFVGVGPTWASSG